MCDLADTFRARNTFPLDSSLSSSLQFKITVERQLSFLRPLSFLSTLPFLSSLLISNSNLAATNNEKFEILIGSIGFNVVVIGAFALFHAIRKPRKTAEQYRSAAAAAHRDAREGTSSWVKNKGEL